MGTRSWGQGQEFRVADVPTAAGSGDVKRAREEAEGEKPRGRFRGLGWKTSPRIYGDGGTGRPVEVGWENCDSQVSEIQANPAWRGKAEQAEP